jgi:dTDP-4-amino-4,6-dideoxy-D-galactose acyltransferase
MIKYLEWDSNFLDFKVGSISQLNIETLELELENAKSEKYKLIYIFAAADCFVPTDFLQKYNGKLVDRKVLYVHELSDQAIANYDQTNLYISPEVSDDLLQLAYESGKYSRFKLDKNLTNKVFTDMYKLWIENSVKGQIADRIYAVEQDNKITAMVTLKTESEALRIGLIATASESQGKGYGKQLINRTKQTAIELGLKHIEVSTQYDNKQACRFYEACGFQIKSITNIYHFWL